MSCPGSKLCLLTVCFWLRPPLEKKQIVSLSSHCVIKSELGVQWYSRLRRHNDGSFRKSSSWDTGEEVITTADV